MKKLPELAIIATAGFILMLGSPAIRAIDAERSADSAAPSAQATIDTLSQHLAPFGIRVAFLNGVATLQGTVESDIERDLAETIAKSVNGVDQVRNELTLKSHPATASADSTKTGAELPQRRPEASLLGWMQDATTTVKIKMQLLWNESTRGAPIHVDTDGSVVTLRGIVGSREQAGKAADIARRVGAVTAVVNQLRVQSLAAEPPSSTAEAKRTNPSGRPINDGWIAAKVKSILIFNRQVDNSDVQVDSQQGVVYLSGAVANEQQKARALDAAGHIEGVKKMNADLKVDGRY